MSNIIHYIFSVGHHYNSVKILKQNNLWKHGGPFDEMIVDLETCLMNIHQRFSEFINRDHLVMIHQGKKYISSYKHVDQQLIEIMSDTDPLTCIYEYYDDQYLVFNQTFLKKNKSLDLYTWDRICLFKEDPFQSHVHNSIQKRCENFNTIYQSQSKYVSLFHITYILDVSIEIYMRLIEAFLDEFEISCYTTIIICTCRLFKQRFEKTDRILFIFKYIQFHENILDFNFHEEIDIMKTQLCIKLY